MRGHNVIITDVTKKSHLQIAMNAIRTMLKKSSWTYYDTSTSRDYTNSLSVIDEVIA